MSADDAADAALPRRAADGDERALRALYDRHAGWLAIEHGPLGICLGARRAAPCLRASWTGRGSSGVSRSC